MPDEPMEPAPDTSWAKTVEIKDYGTPVSSAACCGRHDGTMLCADHPAGCCENCPDHPEHRATTSAARSVPLNSVRSGHRTGIETLPSGAHRAKCYDCEWVGERRPVWPEDAIRDADRHAGRGTR